jgi:hypothetical protein
MKNYSRANTGIDLNLIPVFIEVVRCGSMAKASVRLEMSPGGEPGIEAF